MKRRTSPLHPLLAAAALAAALGSARTPESRADVPPVLLPPRRDSTASIESPPAPLLVPGRPNPGDADTRTKEQRAKDQYEVARGLEEQGTAAAAIIAYQKAVQLDPKLRDAHFRMGRLYVAVGQHAVAAREFAAEVTLDPGNARVARELGLALANAGDSANAMRQLERLVRRNGRDTLSWKALGYAYGLADRQADAERAMKRATELAPGDASAWRDLGVVLALRRRPAEARAAYARAAKLAPRDGSAHVNLGNLEVRERRWPEALAAYREAEARDSTLAFAYRGQVRALRALGREAEAGATFRRWLAAHPGDSDARLEAIRHFDALGRADVALELAREGVRADPRSGEARIGLALALEASGDVPGMLAELRRAEGMMRTPEQRSRLAATIASLRAKAPDSLRAVFAADSAAHEGAAASRPGPADTTRRR